MQRNRSNLDFLRRFVLFLLSVSITKIFRIRVINKESLDEIERNPVILGNHYANWDPIWITAAFHERICFLASDFLFRRPFLGRLLQWAGMISKQKFHVDLPAIKALKKAHDAGNWVGLYPEGEASWSGNLAPFVKGTGKLLKFLDAPVLCVRSWGAYNSQVRWSTRKKLHPITLEISTVIGQDQVRKLSSENLESLIHDALYSNPWLPASPSNSEKIKFLKKMQAPNFKGLDGVLIACPNCEAGYRLKAGQKIMECSSCGVRAHLNADGLLSWSSKFSANQSLSSVPKNIFAWFDYQDTWMIRKASYALENLDQQIYFEEHSAQKGKKFRKKVDLSCRAQDKVLVLRTENNETWDFPLCDMKRANVQMGERLEFRYNNRIYMFQFKRPASGYPLYRWLSLNQKGV